MSHNKNKSVCYIMVMLNSSKDWENAALRH